MFLLVDQKKKGKRGPKPLPFFFGQQSRTREGGFLDLPCRQLTHERGRGGAVAGDRADVRQPVPLRLTPIASSSTEGERGFAKGLRPLAGDSRTPVGKEKEGGAGGLTHGRLSPPRSSPTLAPQRGTDDEGRRSGLGFGDLDPTRPPPGRPPSPDAGDTAANRVGRGR